MREPSIAGRRRASTSRVVVVCLVALTAASLSGCGWWSRWRSAPAARSGPPEGPPPLSVAEARAACPNYDRAFATSVFPRDAFARGVNHGNATVRFNVDGSVLTVTRVTSTDSAFADDAVAVVHRLACHVDRPSTFEMSFPYHRDS